MDLSVLRHQHAKQDVPAGITVARLVCVPPPSQLGCRPALWGGEDARLGPQARPASVVEGSDGRSGEVAATVLLDGFDAKVPSKHLGLHL